MACLQGSALAAARRGHRLHTQPKFHACRVRAIVQYLLDRLPDSEILLLGLLPRGDAPGYDYQQPSLFTAALERVNERYR